MSGGALFSNNSSRGSSKWFVEFKAGKMIMKGKMVYPDTRKGQVYVYQSEDSLMHFCWKDRTTGIVEDDLIIFPDDCEFKHVPQCETGRVYLLRFKSTSRRFFFWLQDLKTDKDKEYCKKVNEVLNNPPTPGSQRSGGANHEGDLQNLLNNMSQQQLMQLFGGVGQIGGLGNLLGTLNRPHSARTTTATASAQATRAPPIAHAPTPEAPRRHASCDIPPCDRPSPEPSCDTPPCETPPCDAASSEASKPADTPKPVQRTPTPTSFSARFPQVLNDSMDLDLPRLPSLGDWELAQSGQAGPVIRQFGLGPEAVSAAASGNLEEFISALESEVKAGQPAGGQQATSSQQQQKNSGEDDKSKKPSTTGGGGGTPAKKKDDDDEGMALD